ncbi:sensor histidine kinase [Candidatus Micrarchaeota archaeon]|nr:sensor histidine kinase [Candidatus Micrarchaeota archaeon]
MDAVSQTLVRSGPIARRGFERRPRMGEPILSQIAEEKRFLSTFALLEKSTSHEIRNKLSNIALAIGVARGMRSRKGITADSEKWDELHLAVKTISECVENLEGLRHAAENIKRPTTFEVTAFKATAFGISAKMLRALEKAESHIGLLDHINLQTKPKIVIAIGKEITRYMIELTKSGELPYHPSVKAVDGEVKSMRSAINAAVRENLERKWLKVTYHPDENIATIPVEIEPLYLRLTLMNLVSNVTRALTIAAESTGAPPKYELLVEVHAHEEKIVLKFIDQGCGMSESMKYMLNHGIPATTKDSTDPGEHGIGFQYCRELVERMGGKLYVEWTVEGEGTIIALELPRLKTE